MAFCMYCGKQLEEGQQCNCLEASGQAENPVTENRIVNERRNISQMNLQHQQGMNMSYSQNNVEFEQVKEKSGAFFQELYEVWVSIVKSPVAAGNRFVQSNYYQTGIGLIVIQAILTGIFGVFICSTINKLMKIGSYMSSDSAISINLVLAFILTAIGSILLSAARTGLLFGSIKISKRIADWKRAICVCGVRAVGVNLIQVVSIVVYLMNPFWGISFFAFSWAAGLIFMIPSILGCMRESEDKGIYIITGVTILCLIILGMLYKIGVPIYVPSELKDGVEGVSDVLKYFW